MSVSIKVKFRASTVPGHQGTIYYQIIYDRQVRQLMTSYRVLPEEWDESRASVVAGDDLSREELLLQIRSDIRYDKDRLTRIARKLDVSNHEFTAQNIVDEFQLYSRKYSLFKYMERVIDRLKAEGKVRTSETYHSTLNSFKKFRDNHDVMLDRITSEMMEDYEIWLHKRGIVPNTVSFYTRILRAVYNRAVDEDAIDDRNPFRRVYTGVDKTVKRALPLKAVCKIKRLDLTAAPALDFARDMFMMSFYLRGMSFIDMAYLKKSDLQNGYVAYRRRKTGQLLVIAWTPEMQAILDKYPENESLYLLPIIRNKVTNDRSVYRNMSYRINNSLKKIAQLAGLRIPLTLYVARHSWASAAKVKGIPLSVISEGMGHESEKTTRIYLASLDTSTIDRANKLIIKSLR